MTVHYGNERGCGWAPFHLQAEAPAPAVDARLIAAPPVRAAAVRPSSTRTPASWYVRCRIDALASPPPTHLTRDRARGALRFLRHISEAAGARDDVADEPHPRRRRFAAERLRLAVRVEHLQMPDELLERRSPCTEQRPACRLRRSRARTVRTKSACTLQVSWTWRRRRTCSARCGPLRRRRRTSSSTCAM